MGGTWLNLSHLDYAKRWGFPTSANGSHNHTASPYSVQNPPWSATQRVLHLAASTGSAEPFQDVLLVVAPATDLSQQLEGVDTRAVIVVPNDVQSPCTVECRILDL